MHDYSSALPSYATLIFQNFLWHQNTVTVRGISAYMPACELNNGL